MAGMNEERKYRKRMAFTVVGVLISIPLFLTILFLVLSFFFNPFRPG